MAYDKLLEERLSRLLNLHEEVSIKKMFGGMCFMYKNKMAVGIVGDQLMVRVVEEKIEEELAKEHVSPMDFTGRPLKGFLYVNQEAVLQDRELRYYIELGLEHAHYASQKEE
jgi:TfoX/Sxy family transcriptional regulator of competence genes